MLPETLMSNRGIVVVPTESKSSLANFIDNAKNNIVLIEVSAKQILIKFISISSNKHKKSAAQCVTIKHVDY